MKCTLQRWVWSIAFFAAAGCAHHADVSRESTQTDYGVSMARMSLWREAMFRFKRAVQMNPGDAMAHNNLAVAYEANGDFENARHEYLEALRLDRSNDYIKKNYSRFVEFLSRNKKRTTTGTKAAGSGTAAPATMPVAGGSAVSGESPRPPDKPVGADPGAIPRPPQPVPQPPPTPPPGAPSQEGAV